MTGKDYWDSNFLVGSNKGSVITSLFIAAAALIIVILVVFIVSTSDSDPEQATEPFPEVKEQEPEEPAADESATTPQQQNGLGNGPEGEVADIEDREQTPEEEEGEAEEPLAEEDSAKDLATIEETAHEWLKIRTEDPDVILVSTSDLDDIDAFFDQYDLSEDNVLVYMVDSVGDEFLTLLFGPPYSEWGLKVVFIWRNNQWEFLREEDIIM